MSETKGQPTAMDAAQQILKDAIPKAAEVLASMLTAEDEKLRIRAAEAILNRAGITEADRRYHGYASQAVGGEK